MEHVQRWKGRTGHPSQRIVVGLPAEDAFWTWGDDARTSKSVCSRHDFEVPGPGHERMNKYDE